MKNAKIILTVIVVLAIMSFKLYRPSEKAIVKTGVYGMCDCVNSSESATKVELTLNEDFTFSYLDNSNPGKIVDIKGKWVLKDNSIFLKDFQSDFSIHDKWKMDKNEKCLVSRKGLEFTRLCHIKSCQ